MPRYDARRIEEKWQQFWEQRKTFKARDFVAGQEKLYVLDMFPYPSGDGLHVGHPEGQTATDIICRHARMKGKNVLHPMGWDAFGLPAEQHAIKTGVHPRIQVKKNIDNFRRQEKMLGFSYDWDREFSTTDEDYFRWTQWIFLQLFDTWYDPEAVWTGPDGKRRTGRGRPIAELPIPADVQRAGAEAVRRYQDKQRLAYQHEAPVNWCPALGTVLANEEVIDGLSERGSHPVERRPLRQWMLRITSYADRLIEDLSEVNWPESIKSLQRNWIGRSVGAEVDFFIGDAGTKHLDSAFKTWQKNRAGSGFTAEPGTDVLRVYTTRPDTLYGATYMVIAPEHPQVDRLTTPAQKEKVEAYRKQAAMKSDLARTDLAKEKTGVFTGSHAINPVNGEPVPVWVADYVLISYGTGAIMAVPAHDLRDWEFAVTFDIPIIQVVAPPADYQHSREEKALTRTVDGQEQAPFAGQGLAVNSGEYTGLSTADFKQKITADLAGNGLGKAAVNFKLRDWLFSRQHYWGEPFPIWHELGPDGKPTGLLRVVPEEELPVTLPDMDDFKPKGTVEPPLAFAPKEWLYKTDKDGTKLMRETNSMPQWAGSCWYYLRFADPKNGQAFIDPKLEKYWLPVDLYIGGAEHAVLHLLYARFWHKALFDRGWLSTPEPFNRLVNQGMILGEAVLTGWQTKDGKWVSLTELPEGHNDETTALIPRPLKEENVTKKDNKFFLKEDNSIQIDYKSEKMSKSRGNVINPDVVVREYGADSLRLFEMFMGPLEQVKPWSMNGVKGVYGFLGRVWRMFVDERADEVVLDQAVQDVPPTEEQERWLHKTIKAVGEDIEKHSFNTAISRMMEFNNELIRAEVRPRSVLEPFLLILSPFAPHLAEELWQLMGHADTLAYEPWPQYDESKLVEASIEIPVQVNGKLRAKIMVPTGADKDTMQKLAEASAEVQSYLAGVTIQKVVVVPGRMVNFVVKQ